MKLMFEGTMDEYESLLGGGPLLTEIARDVATLARQEESFAGSLFEIAAKVNAGAQQLETLMAAIVNVGS